MKGIQGLVVAVVLGLAGVVLNWLYLDRKANEFDKESFIAVAPGTTINVGDTFQRDHFVPVDVPRHSATRLNGVAMPWNLLTTVVGMNATRQYTGDELLLRMELQTAPQEIEAGPGELIKWVPIETGAAVSSDINPGDEVTFTVRKVRPQVTAPPPIPSDGSTTEAPPAPPRPAPESIGYTELIGPFKVLAVGNRKGKTNVLNASRVAPMQENVIAVPIKFVGSTPDALGQKLMDAIYATGGRDIGILLKKAKK